MHGWVQVHSYQTRPPHWTDSFVRSLKAKSATYLVLRDIHDSGKPVLCVQEKKQEIRRGLPQAEDDRILLVRYEIEGWYLAGLDEEHSERLGIPFLEGTDTVTKEDFNRLIPKRFERQFPKGYRYAFMTAILACYDLETATCKNRSFRYFCQKYLKPAS